MEGKVVAAFKRSTGRVSVAPYALFIGGWVEPSSPAADPNSDRRALGFDDNTREV
ncbi:MAG: hypothetical protein ACJARS_004380 [bacterium]|jgi:hypothetical protein